MKLKSQTSAQKKSNENNNKTAPNNSRGPRTHIVVLYYQGLSESFKRTCKKYGIEVHLRGGHTIKTFLWPLKIKIQSLKRRGVIYRYKCDRVDCDHEYIWESARNFEERFKEHLKAPSSIHDHINISGHSVTIEIFPYWEERTKTSLDSSKRPCT